jgi:hypothetical protein
MDHRLNYKRKETYSPVILFWNCCGGVSSKINTIKMIIGKYSPEILFISEAEIILPFSHLNVPDYNLITAPTIGDGKARLVCYVLEQSNFKDITDSIIKNKSDIIILESRSERVTGV